MRSASFVILFAFLLAAVSAPAQLPAVPATQAPQRDPDGLAALSQMLSVTGWNTTQLQDIVAAGTVTRYHGTSQDSVAIKLESQGPRLYRSDVQDPASTITTILNGDGAAVITSSSTQSFASYAAIAMRPSAFPFFAGFLSFADGTYSVKYDGIETIAGQPSYKIELAGTATGSDPISLMRAKVSQITVWIPVANAYPAQIEYTRISLDNPTASRRITRTYSDYRVVNGFAVPFHQEEFAGGQMLMALQLSTVSFNVGVAIADFALPAVQD